ncbi:MAG: exonuclease domain-containing protein [Ignavibacteria bacterium]
MESKYNLNIFDTPFMVCDVETTGLSPINNRITEIALIKVQNFEIIDKFSTLINPQQHIPREITHLTGISNEDVMNKPDFESVSHEIISFFDHPGNPDIIFTGHNAGFDYKFLLHSFLRINKPFSFKSLCTCKLARRLLRRLRSKSLINVAAYFNVNIKRQHRAYDDALATSKILINLLNMLTQEYEFEHVEEILKFQNCRIYNNENKSPALKRMNLSLKDFPKLPGVYFMKGKEEEILYIGKAKNLRERLSSYFRYNSELPVKLRKLLSRIHSIEYEVTNSELSALILESRLIKKNKPRFNSAIKRFRFHPFLKIDIKNDYPKIEKVYEIENDGANYYGPFQSGLTVNRLLKDIKEEFKLRKCDDKNLKPSEAHSTCMYHEIGKCKAPCNLSQTKREYQEEVIKVHNFLTSLGKNSAQNLYEMMMTGFSEQMEYERAAFVRDRLHDIQKVMSYQKVITSAINGKKIIIKCDSLAGKEIFFIHNGKLVKTYHIEKDIEFDQRNIFEELTETTEYLFFSLSKYVRHKFNPFELDEIKVISNWLALNRDRNTVLEINDRHSRQDVESFLIN